MKKCLLVILDGYGESPVIEGNAVKQAHSPNLDAFFADNPLTLINCSGGSVGLPEGQMGNSEVGHLNMGAGRVVYQELTKISKAISDGDFFERPAFKRAVDNVIKNDSALHIMGLTSNGGVHSAREHYKAIVELAKINGLNKVYFHCFTDGRDTLPDSALGFVNELEAYLKEQNTGKIASVCGRYYAMDRDSRYERIELAYDMLTKGEAESFACACDAISASYDKKVFDEFIQPCIIRDENGEVHPIKHNDSVIFFNFRADRARQLTKALTQDDFSGFERELYPKPLFVCMTEYESLLKNVEVAFGPETMKNTLGEYLSDLGLKQLRIAETEKYAHVTYFFNGGVETPYSGEERVLVPSPKVATYDLKPEMSAYEVTEKLCEAIRSLKYDFIAVNYANCDMVGHTGVFPAAVKAVETVDECVGDVLKAAEEAAYNVVITADHGNAEQMLSEGKPFTAHTTNKVKLAVRAEAVKRLNAGSLCDVAPSILELMEIPKPEEMTGKTLIVK